MSSEEILRRSPKQRIVDFWNEIGMLRYTPRSGYFFLGSGKENVAEHSYRTAVIGYTLARKSGADPLKTLLLCLFHDLPEARTGDFNYVNRMYDTSRETEAFRDAVEGTGLEDELNAVWTEHVDCVSQESILAHDADQLDFILNLKRESVLGNKYAEKWLTSALPRLKTEIARDLAETVLKTEPDDWWYLEADKEWWATRGECAQICVKSGRN